MQIQVDTREHAKEWERIKTQFDAAGIQYYRSKLFVGDYMNLDNPRLVVDRKKDLQELCGNVCQQHKRFRDELMRAKNNGIRVVILCEHGSGIESMNDVCFWQNPRKQVKWRTIKGKRVKAAASEKALDGDQLAKILRTMSEKYDVQFIFCDKQETGSKIVEILAEMEESK